MGNYIPNSIDSVELCEILKKSYEIEDSSMRTIRFHNNSLCNFVSNKEEYLHIYDKYMMFFNSDNRKYLYELKNRFYMEPTATGLIYSPIEDRRIVVIHILEIDLEDIPLYTESEDLLVREISRWRLRRGK